MIKSSLIFLIFLMTTPSQALLMSGVYGKNTDSQFIKNYYLRFLTAEQNQKLLIKSQISKDDKKLMSLWQEQSLQWGYQPEEHHIFENFYFSYSYSNGNLTDSSLFIGLETWPENLWPFIETSLKSRKQTLDIKLKPYFFGIEWHLLSSQTDIHLLFKKRTDFERYFPDLLDISKKHPLDQWHETVSLKLTQKGPQVTFLAKTIPRNELPPLCPPDLFSIKKRVSHQGIEWQLNLRSLFTQMLSPQAQPLIEIFRKEFYLTPDNIIFKDPHNFTLIYP